MTTMDTQTKTHTFSDDEKKEFRMIEQTMLQGKIQLADIEMHMQNLAAKKAAIIAQVHEGGKQLTNRIQLAMKVRGLDPDDMSQRYDMDMRELVLKQTPAMAPAVQ